MIFEVCSGLCYCYFMNYFFYACNHVINLLNTSKGLYILCVDLYTVILLLINVGKSDRWVETPPLSNWIDIGGIVVELVEGGHYFVEVEVVVSQISFTDIVNPKLSIY